jgi:pyruvate formate lyase activating enzyme
MDCLVSHADKIYSDIEGIHRQARQRSGMPGSPGFTEGDAVCDRCANECAPVENTAGWCGVREKRAGGFLGGDPETGRVHYYRDGLPTNCVASTVCPAAKDWGYPRYSTRRGPEYDKYNLAVFYYSCGFNCLFCQNWQYQEGALLQPYTSAGRVVEAVDGDVTCICFFGGDPSPQMPHALAVAKEAIRRRDGDVLRICWETNGSMGSAYLGEVIALSLDTGGIIKFDLKAWSEPLHVALCGASNLQTLLNFKQVAAHVEKRKDYPLLVASTLLVPGYIDAGEVSQIAAFIAACNPEIPYALLAFAPAYKMTDLPTTSRAQAERCEAAALEAGVKQVILQNKHLLS